MTAGLGVADGTAAAAAAPDGCGPPRTSTGRGIDRTYQSPTPTSATTTTAASPKSSRRVSDARRSLNDSISHLRCGAGGRAEPEGEPYRKEDRRYRAGE